MFTQFFEGLYTLQAQRCAAVGMARVMADRDREVGPVNPNILNIGTVDRCVLGQRYGSYSAGLSALGLTDGPEAALYGFRVKEGFLSRTIGNQRAHELLTRAWRRIIVEDGRLLHAAKAA